MAKKKPAKKLTSAKLKEKLVTLNLRLPHGYELTKRKIKK
jgi:hypothetical protein